MMSWIMVILISFFFFNITSELFTYRQYREHEQWPTCSEIAREDLWSTVYSPQYPSPAPSLERVLTMAVY